MSAEAPPAVQAVVAGDRRRTTPELLCTLGPASLDRLTIRRLEQSGATLFRINLSHARLATLPAMIETIRDATEVPVCLDTEGAQIRTGDLLHGSIELHDNTTVRVHLRPVPGDDRNLNLYPRDVVHLLEPGDFLAIDFNAALVQVVDSDDDGVSMRVLRGGLVGQNKGVSVEREIPMPALTVKDRAALEVCDELGLRHYALSFARCREDVLELRRHVAGGAFVIAKIETRAAVEALEEIAAVSDALLIDRGDLSRQIPIERLPRTQKRIIARAKAVHARVYVATNLLESMVSVSTPTRAEVNDIYNTLADGADGLVLAAETAIGRFPVQCASMVRKVIHGFQRDDDARPGDLDAVTLLVAPHGGDLVRRTAQPSDLESIAQLRHVRVSTRDLMDCEQLANGTYSPLTGFMDRESLRSVLESFTLPSGDVWTLPILLQVPPDAWPEGRPAAPGERVALTDDRGTVHAVLDVTDSYRYDLEELTLRMFGTSNPDHPGVGRLKAQGDHFVGGDVKLVKVLPSPYRQYFLPPAETRFVFSMMGWSQVVGFHTRNPAHRGHQSIQLESLERTGADGIYINPVASPEKPGDFLPGPVLMSYQTLAEFGHYPRGRMLLGSFFTYSRYAGPREAVFSALCRKNMGCSHFIVGRDHTGTGTYYHPAANRELFESLGDLGIEPVFFEAVGYNPRTGRYEADEGQPLDRISGTQVREALRSQRRLPDWFMSDVVQDVLLNEISSGRPVFRE